MSPAAPPELLVLSPLAAELEEVMGLLGRELGPGQRVAVPGPASLLRFGVSAEHPGGVVLGWSGMGRAATEAALRSVEGSPPRALLHVGVAGGLRPDLVAGDMVRCRRIVDGGGGGAAEVAGHGLPESVERALAGIVAGASVTVDAIVSTPDGKRGLRARFPEGDVVEMESLWVVRWAARVGVPAVCVRAVCDAADEVLPDLSPGLDAVGRPRPLAFARHLARNPGAIGSLPRLASAFGRARGRLTALVLAACRESLGR